MAFLIRMTLIRLSRIMGHALRALQNPRALSPEERDSRVRNLEAELDCWLAETPDFFHPARCQDASHEVFTQVLALFQRCVCIKGSLPEDRIDPNIV
jgi:hypothetical protein